MEGDKSILDGWFLLWQDKDRVGASALAYAKAYRENPKRETNHSQSTVSQYLGAIDRAVKKYGSLSKVKSEYKAWVTKNYFGNGEIATFMKWAPEGQRAKSSAEKPRDFRKEAMKYSVKELEKMLAFRKAAMSDKFAR